MVVADILPIPLPVPSMHRGGNHWARRHVLVGAVNVSTDRHWGNLRAGRLPGPAVRPPLTCTHAATAAAHPAGTCLSLPAPAAGACPAPVLVSVRRVVPSPRHSRLREPTLSVTRQGHRDPHAPAAEACARPRGPGQAPCGRQPCARPGHHPPSPLPWRDGPLPLCPQ